MAVVGDCVVHIRENPLEEYEVWERREPQSKNSYRSRKKCELPRTGADTVSKDIDTKMSEYEPEDKIANRVNTGDFKSSDFHYTGYAVLAAASKGSKSAGRGNIIDESANRLNLTSPSYQTFHRRHTSGKTTYAKTLHVQDSKQIELEVLHRTRPRRESYDYENDPSLFPGIFCCGRSAHSIIEEGTCMCCVKGIFYHCTKDLNDGESRLGAQEPCTCGSFSNGCMKRWTLLTVCSIFLPCLCCYIPAKGCSDVYKNYKEHKISCQRRRAGGLDR